MSNGLNHDFCDKFRSEIKNHGLVTVVSELIASNSDKVELKKRYIARECRKSAFAGKFKEACDTVAARDGRAKASVFMLKQEIGLIR